MMRRLVFFLFLSLCVFPVSSQKITLEDFFISKLNSQIPVSAKARMELITQYHKEGKKELKLNNGSVITLLEYEPNKYLKIRTSKSGTFSLKKWDLGANMKEDLFGMVWTVCGTTCDGTLKLAYCDSLRYSSAHYHVMTPARFANLDSLKSEGLSEKEFNEKFEIEFYNYEFTKGDTVWAFHNTPANLDPLRRKRYEKYWKGNAIPIYCEKNNLKVGDEVYSLTPEDLDKSIIVDEQKNNLYGK